MRRVLALAALAAVLVVGVSYAQVRQDAGAAARPLPGLPVWTAGYRGWFKVNRLPIPPRRSRDAHGGTKNVYASRRARGGRYSYGTVIVKEITRPRERFIGILAAMRKVRGANPSHNDWVMIEWERSSTRERFDLLARGAICTSCHVQVRKDDYVFTRR